VLVAAPTQRYHGAVAPHPAAALLSKRWDLLAEYKDQYWRDRKKLGLAEALRVVDSLRTQARLFQPGWPTQDDREEDLQTHIRVAAALARTGPSEAPRSAPRAAATRGRSRVARRDRRVRRVRRAR
jgi:hypothetical protein